MSSRASGVSASSEWSTNPRVRQDSTIRSSQRIDSSRDSSRVNGRRSSSRRELLRKSTNAFRESNRELFGYSLDDYDELFAEKLDLLLKIRDDEKVSWSGRFRSPVETQGIYPRPDQARLPIRVAVGGTPQSIVRAATRGLPVALAIIGGDPERFRVLADLHRRTLIDSGYDPEEVPLSVHGHGYISDTNEQAAEEYYDSYAAAMTRIGRERGWGPMSREQFDMMHSPEGSLVLGDVETVAAKILRNVVVNAFSTPAR